MDGYYVCARCTKEVNPKDETCKNCGNRLTLIPEPTSSSFETMLNHFNISPSSNSDGANKTQFQTNEPTQLGLQQPSNKSAQRPIRRPLNQTQPQPKEAVTHSQQQFQGVPSAFQEANNQDKYETPTPQFQRATFTNWPEEPRPLRVIGMEKKFALVAIFKDILVPGTGFMYAESVKEGAVIGLITIPLTLWAVLHYIQLWFGDIFNSVQVMSAHSDAGFDFIQSDPFKVWAIVLSLLWIGIRCLWLSKIVKEHNKKIEGIADINQMLEFVDRRR